MRSSATGMQGQGSRVTTLMRPARVLIMFFQNKWAFAGRGGGVASMGVPGNHGNPVTPLSGHGVSSPRRRGYLRVRKREAREGHNARSSTSPLAFDYPNSSSVPREFLENLHDSRRAGGTPIKINNSRASGSIKVIRACCFSPLLPSSPPRPPAQSSTKVEQHVTSHHHSNCYLRRSVNEANNYWGKLLCMKCCSDAAQTFMQLFPSQPTYKFLCVFLFYVFLCILCILCIFLF